MSAGKEGGIGWTERGLVAGKIWTEAGLTVCQGVKIGGSMGDPLH